MKDEAKLVSRPLVDNTNDNAYLYEIITFTGFKAGASCNSKVQVCEANINYISTDQ